MTDIPETVAAPPDIHQRKPACNAYKAIHRADPALIPPAAADVAVASHRLAANRPTPGRGADDALHAWRAGVEAFGRGEGPMPDIGPVAEAESRAAVARRITHGYDVAWGRVLSPLDPALSAAADGIVAGLRERHDRALAGFLDALGRLDGYDSELDALRAGDGARDAYEQAGHHLSALAAVRACRVALDGLRGYRSGIPEALIVWANPSAAEAATPGNCPDTLERWRRLRHQYAQGVPQMLTVDELRAQPKEDAA